MTVKIEGVALLPVRALVWLRLDSDGDVEEIEVSGDTSWMTLDEKMGPFFAADGSTTDMSREEAAELLLSLVDSDKWRNADPELKLEV